MYPNSTLRLQITDQHDAACGSVFVSTAKKEEKKKAPPPAEEEDMGFSLFD